MKCIRIWVWVSLVCLFSVAGVQAQGTVGAEPESPRAIQVPLGGIAEARVLRIVKFSGELRDAMGRPRTVPQGGIGVTFALYEQQEGGAARWLETQNIELDAQGRYSVLLGATRTEGLPLELFTTGEARWLGIQVEGEAEQPRVLLVSVPYALKAADADTLGGKPASAFVLAEAAAPAAATRAGGSPSSNVAIDSGRRIVSQIAAVSGTGTPNKLTKWTDTSGALGDSALTESGGNLGLGTATPSSPNGFTTVFQMNGPFPLARLSGANRNFGLGIDAANVVRFFEDVPDAPTALAIDPAGKVGIGTTTPVARLEVIDVVKIGTTTVLRAPFAIRGQALEPNTVAVVGVAAKQSSTAGLFDNRSGGPILIGQVTDGSVKFRVEGTGDVISTEGDFQALGPGKGVILKSPNGAICAQVSIGDSGALVTTPLPCPQPCTVANAWQAARRVLVAGGASPQGFASRTTQHSTGKSPAGLELSQSPGGMLGEK